jgi:L-ascorbate metabolism protein UlaG (beta-lactamase superfamily)
MDIYWLGHASFLFKGKTAKVVTDPFDPEMLGLKYPLQEADIVTISHQHGDHNALDRVKNLSGEQPLVISGPGEYESKGISIFGVASYHDEEKGQKRGKNTIYVFDIDGVKICHLGDLGHKLDESQLKEIANIDVLLVPVGGFYTIDAPQAAEVVAQTEPLIVIPMHYKSPEMKAPDFDQVAGVEPFLKTMGVETTEPQSKVTVVKDGLPEQTQVIVMERRSG